MKMKTNEINAILQKLVNFGKNFRKKQERLFRAMNKAMFVNLEIVTKTKMTSSNSQIR